MRYRHVLPLAGLLAAAVLGGCTEEKKDARAPMTEPAPAADPTKPGADKPVEPKPVPDQPPLKK